MSRYILMIIQTQAIKGCPMEKHGERPFVSLAEAYETLARTAKDYGEESWKDFISWRVCEVRNVEE